MADLATPCTRKLAADQKEDQIKPLTKSKHEPLYKQYTIKTGSQQQKTINHTQQTQPTKKQDHHSNKTTQNHKARHNYPKRAPLKNTCKLKQGKPTSHTPRKQRTPN
jgi:hypothetical protein